MRRANDRMENVNTGRETRCCTHVTPMGPAEQADIDLVIGGRLAESYPLTSSVGAHLRHSIVRDKRRASPHKARPTLLAIHSGWCLEWQVLVSEVLRRTHIVCHHR